MKVVMCMKIEPVDIKNQRFKVKFRGFDVKAVDSFLQSVAEELEEEVQENQALQDEIDQLKSILAEKEKTDPEVLKQRLAEVEETCSYMVKEARLTADEILKDARIELSNLKDEIESTKNFKKQLEQFFESFLNFNTKLLRMWKTEADKVIDPKAARLQGLSNED